MEPIIIFKNRQQAYECLKYYKKLLSLDDWIIDINLDYNSPCIAPAWGKSKIYRAIHVAEILIPMPYKGQINKFPVRYSQEEISVHELLHVRLPSLDLETESTASDFYESEFHASLEATAKALIMSKYNIPMDWYYNN